jgi:hypothetical protein
MVASEQARLEQNICNVHSKKTSLVSAPFKIQSAKKLHASGIPPGKRMENVRGCNIPCVTELMRSAS